MEAAALRNNLVAMLMVCACATASARFAGNDIIVKYRESAARPMPSPEAFAHAHGLAFKKPGKLARTLVIDGGSRPGLTIARLKADPAIEYATRDRWIPLTSTIPDDPKFNLQYNLYNTGQTGGTTGADIQVTGAWDVTTGSQAITIAISDTGCQINHPDLASRIWTNPGEIPGNGIDDDSNGYIDDYYGWDFATNTSNTVPSLGHGTGVLGLAGAASNNAIGVAGANWQARMMVVNGFQTSGFGLESDLVNGVVYAINNGAKIINESWGDYGYSPLEADMALYAQEHGVLLVPASGNEGVDVEEYPFYPACLPFDSVLCVGGSERRDDGVYNGSGVPRQFNYGVEHVQVAASAFSIPLAASGSSYGSGSGTSYAAPQVSGVAGLVLGLTPSMSPSQLKYRIMGTAAAKPGLADRNRSDGRLDANAAVRAQDLIPPGSIGNLAVQTLGWNGAVLSFTAPGGDGAVGSAAFYQFRVTTDTISSSNWYILPYTAPFIRPAASGSTEHLLVNQLVAGQAYNAAVRAVDAAGNQGTISNTVTFSVPASPAVFQDDCNTTNPVWTPVGFTLAPGDANTGTLSWQDSPDAQYLPSSVATLTGGPFNLTGLSRPRLSFYMQRFFPTSSDRVDSLKVEASADGGGTWKLLKRYHGAQAPFRRETLPLDEITGSNTMIRFSVVADSNSIVGDGIYLDDISIHEGAGGVAETRDIIIETIDFYNVTTLPPDYVTSGSWVNDAVLKSLAPKCEGYSSFRTPAGSGATGQFMPFIRQPGKYEVYATWSELETATGVTYRVLHADGQSQRVVDQLSSTGNRWTSVGTYRFNYGRNPASGSIIVDSSTASGQNVRADAIRLRYAELDAAPLVTAVTEWPLYD